MAVLMSAGVCLFKLLSKMGRGPGMDKETFPTSCPAGPAVFSGLFQGQLDSRGLAAAPLPAPVLGQEPPLWAHSHTQCSIPVPNTSLLTDGHPADQQKRGLLYVTPASFGDQKLVTLTGL